MGNSGEKIGRKQPNNDLDEYLEGGQRAYIASEEAQVKLKMEEKVSLNPRFKTLYSGLKLNTQRNSAAIYPIIFLLRRVLLAFTVVFIAESNSYAGLILFMWATMFMAGYTCCEKPWSDHLMNKQHLWNEAGIYLFCLFMTYFTGESENHSARFTMGYVFIGFFVVWLAVNLITVIWQAVAFARRLMKRGYVKVTHKELVKSVSKTASTLRRDVIGHGNPFRDEFILNDQGEKQFPTCVVMEDKTKSGGFWCKIVRETDLTPDELQKAVSQRLMSDIKSSQKQMKKISKRIAPVTDILPVLEEVCESDSSEKEDSVRLDWQNIQLNPVGKDTIDAVETDRERPTQTPAGLLSRRNSVEEVALGGDSTTSVIQHNLNIPIKGYFEPSSCSDNISLGTNSQSITPARRPPALLDSSASNKQPQIELVHQSSLEQAIKKDFPSLLVSSAMPSQKSSILQPIAEDPCPNADVSQSILKEDVCSPWKKNKTEESLEGVQMQIFDGIDIGTNQGTNVQTTMDMGSKADEEGITPGSGGSVENHIQLQIDDEALKDELVAEI